MAIYCVFCRNFRVFSVQIYSPKILPMYKNVNYQVCARFACSNFLFSQIFCEYLKDNRENHTKGNTDVSRLFLLQLMETQIGFKLVGLRNNSKHFHVKIFLFSPRRHIYVVTRHWSSRILYSSPSTLHRSSIA